MDEKIAHLTFVQNIITRMSQCSFQLKGWSVTLISALFALSSVGSDKRFVLLCYFPIVLFWLLDSFFLYKEKKYRLLYKDVSSDNNVEIFSLCVKKYNSSSLYLSSALSITIVSFYGLLTVLVLVFMFGVFK